MNRNIAFSILFNCLLASPPTFGQVTPASDSVILPEINQEVESSTLRPRLPIQTLPEATVRAFELGQRLRDAPVSVGIISEKLLRRAGNASIIPAINTIPGVRMEERSPGSYRLSVRGSSLRAPFGVRNVKVYYNGIPFTDPGGHTYLNSLGYYNISGMEIIKSPGSSLYGAGTGGVVLIESIPARMHPGGGIEATAGSYGLVNLAADARIVDSSRHLQSIVRYQHLGSDGYREHSALRRDVLSWDAMARISPWTWVFTHLLYSDLEYETPGALTRAEYEADPRSARPTVGAVGGASEMNAAVRLKSFVAGATLVHALSERWSFSQTLYGAFSALENPTLRNYGRSSEPHAGGRALLKYRRAFRKVSLEWLIGAEAQQGLAGTQIYGTAFGRPDTLQTDDKLHIRSAAAFSQAALEWRRWHLTVGISINNYRMRYARLSSLPYSETIRDFNNEAAPRISIRYRLGEAASVYASASRGFSPPTSSELSPTGRFLNEALQAEYGWNYEAGLRGSFLLRRLSYDIAVYYFRMANTIVQRRDSAGGDYFINSGSTRQTGAELLIRYNLSEGWLDHFGEISAFAAYTWQRYRYGKFMQLEADYSGKALPGVSPNTIAAGLDWDSRFGFHARLSYNYSDIVPLNDANSAALEACHFFGARIGYLWARMRPLSVELFAGADNLTDVRYSAGPDINGFGGRYYNAAPGRSFYAGISLRR